MSHHIENTFTNYGEIVSGNRFIGRQDDLSLINGRVLCENPGNLAIIGGPRVGKSSLAYHATIARKEEFLAKSILPIWLDLATYKKATDFFCSLVNRSVLALKTQNDWLNRGNINKTVHMWSRISQSDRENVEKVKEFFSELGNANIHVLFILDEFDYARKFFKGDTSGFEALRELAYYPEYKVKYITTSRRSIRSIIKQTEVNSTLDGIFMQHFLKIFNEEDMQEYYSHLERIGVPIDASFKEKAYYYTGDHPYLLSVLGFGVIEALRKQKSVEVEHVMSHQDNAMRPFYEQICDYLREDNRFHTFLNLLFGPITDEVTHTGIDLSATGLIKEDTNGSYIAFSSHFQSYLAVIERGELWSIWSETERALRHLIMNVLRTTYGDNWFDKLEEKYPRLGDDGKTGMNMFQRCRESQQREVNAWKKMASSNPLDFTYPGELFEIIFQEWDNTSFKDIFNTPFKDKSKENKKYWRERTQLLAKVRTPLAHNRHTTIPHATYKIAEGYCHELLGVLCHANV
jgi:hypothetical protein